MRLVLVFFIKIHDKSLLSCQENKQLKLYIFVTKSNYCNLEKYLYANTHMRFHCRLKLTKNYCVLALMIAIATPLKLVKIKRIR